MHGEKNAGLLQAGKKHLDGGQNASAPFRLLSHVS